MSTMFKAPVIRTVEQFEDAIAKGMALRTMGKVKYPQALDIVKKQRDAGAPFHDNIHELSPDCYSSATACMIGDVLLDAEGLL